jgi:hypothetical protein
MFSAAAAAAMRPCDSRCKTNEFQPYVLVELRSMFEKALLRVLSKHLGHYAEFDEDSLKAGIWKGDIILRNLKLKNSLFATLGEGGGNGLSLLSGQVATLQIKIPWKNIYKEAASITVSGIFIVAELAPGSNMHAEAIKERLLERKFEMLEEALTSIGGGKVDDDDSGLMANMAKRVIANLQFNLEDFHLKIFAGSDLSIGITCHVCKAITTASARSKEALSAKDTDNVLTATMLHKWCEFKCLTVYCDSKAQAFNPMDPFAAMSEDIYRGEVKLMDPKFVLRPMSGAVRISLDKSKVLKAGSPRMDIKAEIEEMNVCVNAGFFKALNRISDVKDVHKIRMDNLDQRPPTGSRGAVWLTYAANCVRRMIRHRRKGISWFNIQTLSRQRIEYLDVIQKLDSIAAASSGLQFGEEKQKRLQERAVLEKRVGELRNILPTQLLLAIESERLRAAVAKKKDAKDSKIFASGGTDPTSLDKSVMKFKSAFSFGKKSEAQEAAAEVASAMSEEAKKELMRNMASASDVLTVDSSDQTFMQFELDVKMLTLTLLGSFRSTQEVVKVVMMDVISTTSVRGGVSAISVPPLVQVVSLNELQILYRNPDSKFPNILQRVSPNQFLPMLLLSIEIEALGHSSSLPDLKVDCKLDPVRMVYDPCCIEEILATVSAEADEVSLAHRSQFMIFSRQLDDACVKKSSSSESLATLSTDSVINSTMSQLKMAQKLVASFSWCIAVKVLGLTVIIPSNCVQENVSIMSLRLQGFDLQSDPMELIRQRSEVVSGETNWLNMKLTNFDVDVHNGSAPAFEAQWKKQGGLPESSSRFVKQISFDVNVVGSRGALYSEIKLKKDLAVWSASVILPRVSICLTPEVIDGTMAVFNGIDNARANFFELYKDGCAWADVRHSGNLWVSDGPMSKPTQVYVVLSASEIFFFKSERESHPFTAIDLIDCNLVKDEAVHSPHGSSASSSASFYLHVRDDHKRHVYTFTARKKDEATTWCSQIGEYLKHINSDMENRSSVTEDARPVSPAPSISSGRKMSMSKLRGSGAWHRPSVDAGTAAAIIQSSSIFRLSFLSQSFCIDFFALDTGSSNAPLASFVLSDSEVALQLENDFIRGSVTVKNFSLWRDMLADQAITHSENALTHAQCILCSGFALRPETISSSTSARRAFVERIKNRELGAAVHISIHHVLRGHAASRSASSHMLQNLTPSVRGLSTSFVFNMGQTVVNASPQNILSMVLIVKSSKFLGENEGKARHASSPGHVSSSSSADAVEDESFDDVLSMQFNERMIETIQANRTICGRALVQSIEVLLFEKNTDGETHSLFASASMKGLRADFCLHSSRMVEANISLKKVAVYDSRSVSNVADIDGLHDLWGRRAVRRPVFGSVRNGRHLLKVAIRVSPKIIDDTHETDIVLKLADARFVVNTSFVTKALQVISALAEETSLQVIRHIPAFSVGDRVVTQGLSSVAANGAQGVIERGLNPATGRYIVKLLHPPEVVSKFGPTVDVLADKIHLAPTATEKEKFTPRTRAAVRPPHLKAESFYRGFKLSASISGCVVVVPRAVGDDVLMLNSGDASLSSQFVRHPDTASYYLESRLLFQNGGICIGCDPHIHAKERRFRPHKDSQVSWLVHAIEAQVSVEHFIDCDPPAGVPATKTEVVCKDIAVDISEPNLTLILSVLTENITPGLAAWNTRILPSKVAYGAMTAVAPKSGTDSEISLQIPSISLTMIADLDCVARPYVRVQMCQVDARSSRISGVSQLSLISGSLVIEDLIGGSDPDVCYTRVMFPNGSHSGPQLIVKRNSFVDGSVDTAISLGGSRLVIVHELIRITVESLSRAIQHLHLSRGRLNPYGTLAEIPLQLLEQSPHYVDTSDDDVCYTKELSGVGTAKDDAWIDVSSSSISERFIAAQNGSDDREFHVAPFRQKDDEHEVEGTEGIEIREIEESIMLDEDVVFDGSNRLLVIDRHTNCVVIDGQGVHSVQFSRSRKSHDIIIQDGLILVFKRITIRHLEDVDLKNKIHCVGSNSSFEFGSEVSFVTSEREELKRDSEVSWRVNCLLSHHDALDTVDVVLPIAHDQAGFPPHVSMSATVDGSKVVDDALATIRDLLQKLASEPKAERLGKHTLKVTSREQELILVEDPFNRSSRILCLRLSADYTSLHVGMRSKVVVSAHSASIRFATADGQDDQSGIFLFPTSFSLQYEGSSSGMSSIVVSAGFAEFLCSFSSFSHAITMFRSFRNSIFPAIESAQDTIKEFKLQSGETPKADASSVMDDSIAPNICVDAGGILITVFDDCDLKAQPVMRLSMEGFRVALIPNDLVPSQQRFSIFATFSANAFNTRVGHWEQILDDFELEADVLLEDKQSKKSRTFECNLRIGSDTQPLVMSVTDGAFTGICDVMGRWSTGFTRLMSAPSSSSGLELGNFRVDKVISKVVSEDYVLQNATGESIIISFSDAFAIVTRHKVTGSKRAVQQSTNSNVTDYFLDPGGVISFRLHNAETSSSLIHDRHITVAVPTGPNRRISARLHLLLSGVSVLHLQGDSKSSSVKGDERLDVVARISRSQSTSQNQIILTSMFCVRNNIERPIILEFVSAGIGTPFATIAPGCVDSVPVKQAMQYLAAGNGMQISMRPVGSEHLSPSLVSWSSREAMSYAIAFTDVGIDCCVSGVAEVGLKTQDAAFPLCSIITSLYVLKNNLPMPFSVVWDDERKVIEPGTSTVLNGLLTSEKGNIIIQLLHASNGSKHGQPVAVSIISPATRAQDALQYVNFDQQVVGVEVKFRDGSDQARDITVFAPFLMKNNTDICMDARKRKLLQSKTTEIAGEIVRIRSSAQTEWTVLPLKESTGLGKKRLSIREADSAFWSDMFTVDAPGSSGTVELTTMHGTLIMPVGVSIETGKGFLSRSICVQVNPLLSLLSYLDSPLLVRQAYVDAVIGCVAPGCSMPILWSANAPKGTKRHVQVALASSPDGARWSIPLDVQNSSDFLVSVPACAGDSRTTLRVAIVNTGASLKIEVHNLGADDFITNISNETSRSLFVKQYGCDQDAYVELLPQSTTPYVWFDPTCTSAGAQKKISVALAPTGQQPVSNYTLDKIQILKTADLMQQAGLKVFASLTCSAGFNVLRLSEKSFELGVEENGANIKKNDVDGEFSNQENDSTDAFFKVDISVPSTHISLVDAAPRELVCAYIKKFSLGFSRQHATNSFDKVIETLSVSVANLQVDNQMPSARHAVLLASSSENEGNDVFELSVIRCLDAKSSVLQCPYVSFVLRNIDVCVDPVIITAGAACCRFLFKSMREAHGLYS